VGEKGGIALEDGGDKPSTKKGKTPLTTGLQFIIRMYGKKELGTPFGGGAERGEDPREEGVYGKSQWIVGGGRRGRKREFQSSCRDGSQGTDRR